VPTPTFFFLPFFANKCDNTLSDISSVSNS